MVGSFTVYIVDENVAARTEYGLVFMLFFFFFSFSFFFLYDVSHQVHNNFHGCSY